LINALAHSIRKKVLHIHYGEKGQVLKTSIEVFKQSEVLKTSKPGLEDLGLHLKTSIEDLDHLKTSIAFLKTWRRPEVFNEDLNFPMKTSTQPFNTSDMLSRNLEK
jgi:hypothetical protein